MPKPLRYGKGMAEKTGHAFASTTLSDSTQVLGLMTGSPHIPKEEQIDAFLSGRIKQLVSRYCGGNWSDLAKEWNADIGALLREAKQRGLSRFVSLRPTSDGFWLLETETGYVVFYLERGARAYHQEFTELEPAFLHWLDQELRVMGLPVLA